MSKFKKFLSRFGEDAYKSRAERILKQAQSAQTDLIRGLESKIIELENQLEDLLDVAPDSTTSTVVKSIDAKKIVTRYHELSIELEMVKRELYVAKSNTVTLFEETSDLPI